MKQTTLAISLALLGCGQVGTTDGGRLDRHDAGNVVEPAPSMPPAPTPATAEHSPDAGAMVSVVVPVPRIEVEEHQEDDQEDAGDASEPLDAGKPVDAGDASKPLDAGKPVDVDAGAIGGDGPATGAALTPEQIATLCALPEPPPEAAPFCP
jgi:hypothetical protein